MPYHHVGALLWQQMADACAVNKKGVAKQCTKQSELANAPQVSDFFIEMLIYDLLMQLSCKYNDIACYYNCVVLNLYLWE
ncbi:hypothetical protein [Tamlana crocina]|uniref:hypothetical protein n=1 Tax=Tamlana crocina TaxID=393006 RepID=UPI001FD811E5|nr:hypothetical protein [Tamlana crocina]